MSKYGLIHLLGYFDNYCRILELVYPFRREKILAQYFSKKSQPNKWMRAKELKRKGCGSFRGFKQKGIGKRQESFKVIGEPR